MGEDYIGETAALNKKLRRTKGARVPHLMDFDSEEALFDYEEELQKNDSSDNRIIQARRRYMAYWGAVKREWADNHEPWNCSTYCQPTDRRGWACYMCQCSGPFRCICNEGKKRLSPQRIVFWNSRIASDYRNLIYVVGEGIYVPKKNPIPATDWREVSWNI